MTNSFVEYLTRFYTGGATHEGVFDEYNLEERQYETVLHVETDVHSNVMALFHKAVPPSVILTGNAGDGKTRLARSVIENLTGKPLTDWGSNDKLYKLQMTEYTLCVIKDLSDYTRERAQAILSEVAHPKSDGAKPVVYLIAANEGKLRDSLPDINTVRANVQKQLTEGPDLMNPHLILFNLNLERTSRYVKPLLIAMTNEPLWEECNNCPARAQCPILFNHERLANGHVQERITTLYQIVEQSGVHVTMRDMLIHLTHTLVGATNCDQVLTREEAEPWRHVYYENCWAQEQPIEYRRLLNVVSHLDKLEIGSKSHFDIDTYILHGEQSGTEVDIHEQLFASELDMGFGLFARHRIAYLEGNGSESTDEPPEVLRWLPHCRRKLFFEWISDRADQLIALQTVQEFRQYVESADDWDLNNRALPQVLSGLNRALTGFFLTGENIKRELYVTSQFKGTSNTVVPIIKVSIADRDMELQRYPFVNPDRLKLCFRRIPELGLEIDQLLYEHIIRLAEGGTHNILTEECGLRLHNFKDQLLGNLQGLQNRVEARALEFFATVGGQHLQLKLVVQDGKVKVQ
jgi:hypothetical protein